MRIGLRVDLVQDKIVLNRTERRRKRCFSSDESITQWGVNVDKLMKGPFLQVSVHWTAYMYVLCVYAHHVCASVYDEKKGEGI